MSAQKPILNRGIKGCASVQNHFLIVLEVCRPDSGLCIVVFEWITVIQEVVCPCVSVSPPAACMCVKQWGRMLLRPSHNREKWLLLSSLWVPHKCVCVCVSPLDAFRQVILLMLETKPQQATARSGDHLGWYKSLLFSCFRAKDQNNCHFLYLVHFSSLQLP